MAHTFDPALVDVLACPCDAHGSLRFDRADATLTCAACERRYDVRDGVPVLLLDQARPAPTKEASP